MKDTLVNQLNVMSDDIADALLNANLNIPQVNVAFCSNSRMNTNINVCALTLHDFLKIS